MTVIFYYVERDRGTRDGMDGVIGECGRCA